MEENKVLLDVQGLKMHFPVRGKGLSKNGGVLKAVDDVSFSIQRGRTFGLVGESGCGKTTVGRTILKLYQATAGKVIYNGKDLTAMTDKEFFPMRRELQMIFQDPMTSLDPRQTVNEIVGGPLRLQKMVGSKKEQDERVLELLHMVGLKDDHANRYPHEFSGGQRQRIGIARALGLELRQVCLLVCGSQISQEGQMQLLSLAVTAGAVRLQEPRCEALRSRLWRSCGVVPEGAVPPGLTPVALLFPGGQPPRAALTADLTGEGTCESGLFWRPGLLPPEGAMASLPQNADPAGFAAILWRCGAIQAREIRVPHLDIRPAAPYNNELVTDFDLHNLQDTGGTFHAKTIQIDC